MKWLILAVALLLFQLWEFASSFILPHLHL